jgi:hypothetical protein
MAIRRHLSAVVFVVSSVALVVLDASPLPTASRDVVNSTDPETGLPVIFIDVSGGVNAGGGSSAGSTESSNELPGKQDTAPAEIPVTGVSETQTSASEAQTSASEDQNSVGEAQTSVVETAKPPGAVVPETLEGASNGGQGIVEDKSPSTDVAGEPLVNDGSSVSDNLSEPDAAPLEASASGPSAPVVGSASGDDVVNIEVDAGNQDSNDMGEGTESESEAISNSPNVGEVGDGEAENSGDVDGNLSNDSSEASDEDGGTSDVETNSTAGPEGVTYSSLGWIIGGCILGTVAVGTLIALVVLAWNRQRDGGVSGGSPIESHGLDIVTDSARDGEFDSGSVVAAALMDGSKGASHSHGTFIAGGREGHDAIVGADSAQIRKMHAGTSDASVAHLVDVAEGVDADIGLGRSNPGSSPPRSLPELDEDDDSRGI